MFLLSFIIFFPPQTEDKAALNTKKRFCLELVCDAYTAALCNYLWTRLSKSVHSLFLSNPRLQTADGHKFSTACWIVSSGCFGAGGWFDLDIGSTWPI